MMKVADVQTLKQTIDSYEKHFIGAPLLVGIDCNKDYTALLELLKDDSGKQIIRMSDRCENDIPPEPSFEFSVVGTSAKTKPVIWLGAVQSKMLYGSGVTEKFLLNLLGTSFSGPVTVLCPFCCNILENIGRNYTKLGRNIILANGEKLIPSIQMCPDYNMSYPDSVHGIKALLYSLEDGTYAQNINLLTKCNFSYLADSMYPVSASLSPYQLVCQFEFIIADRTEETNGSAAQWQNLACEIQRVGKLSDLCEEKLCSINELPKCFGEYFVSGPSDKRFLCFICLKVFHGTGDDYLSYCLINSRTDTEFEDRLYTAILDIAHDDKHFFSMVRERQSILSALDENGTKLKDYCVRATIKGKDILWYITDKTEEERAALIHALCSYTYTTDELTEMLNFSSPQLAVYLKTFTFDDYNTRVMESDAHVRALLTDYFQRYKIQKLANRQDRDFVDLVEIEAKTRSFTRLQARSAIVKKLDKSGAKPYFFDALGVEFLSFIQEKAEEYGMQFECFVGHCNLPSITSKNKEFYDAFPPDSIVKEERLDDVKHNGTKYNFQFTTEPLHIFDELFILDSDLKKIRDELARGDFLKAIILSDHGASRLAVTYQSENEHLQLSEPGKHSGRCCPAENDPGIDFVTFEDGFAVLANYERFKGSRKADVETHGGASLEETVVPVIILTPKPKQQIIYFVDSSVSCSPKDGSSIRLFSNPPLKKPRMVVAERNYEGRFEGDKHNVVFEMPDIRRKGHHEAVIFDGCIKIIDLTFETKRQTGTNQLF